LVLTEALKGSVGEIDEKKANRILDDFLASKPGSASAKQVLEACQEGMGIIGDRFEKGELFVGDLIVAGDLLTRIVEKLKPLLLATGERYVTKGVVVLGTVEGDIHDIGKNIFKIMLEAASFKVVDIGIDASPARFVEAVREHSPDIVGLSGVLTLSVESMKRIADALEKAGLRNGTLLIIGGSGVNANACTYIGADVWSQSAPESVKICAGYMKDKADSRRRK
jgi:methanogenic corrinoid protein MtbC1